MLVVARYDGANRSGAEASKKKTDQLIVFRFLVRKRFPEMEHYVVEGIIEQCFKIALALLIRSYLLNRFLDFSIKIVVRVICEIRQYLIDTADLGRSIFGTFECTDSLQ